MPLSKIHRTALAAIAASTAFYVLPAPALADDAQEIQALKDQLHAMQQRLDELSAHAGAAGDTGAATTAGALHAAPAAKSRSASPLTWGGITVYGTVDAGVAYLNHGAPPSATYGPGLPFLIQKFSNRSIVSAASNGLSQSKLGVSGREPLTDDLFAVFQVETGFSPTSGRLMDGPASLVNNNGKAVTQQTTSGDSSRAGQILNGPAYVGLGSKMFGTLDVGRQNNLMADDLTKYDPQQQSQAFSPIGYSGTSGGMGDTEDKILDSTAKYTGSWGPARLALLHQFGQDGTLPGTANEFDVGTDIGDLSVDVLWSHTNDAINVTSLSATQVKTLPTGSLSGTVSDNSAWSVQASYNLKPVKLYGGWERMHYGNPDHPITAGSETIGGYVVSAVNNTAYTINKIFTIDWLGARYSVTRKLDLTGAVYQYHQDSYAAATCSTASSGSCSGDEYDISGVADYHFTNRFDTYLGVNWSEVRDGLANGYLNRSAWAPMVGGRFNF